MKMVRSVTASALATAMLATSVTPAMARDFAGFNRGYGYNYGHFRHRDRGVRAGDVIAGVAVIGIIAAIASAASRSNRRNGGINSENEAADACSVSAEQQIGSGARVDGIDEVFRTRDGYEVRGTIDSRGDSRGYRRGGVERFTCSVRFGAVENVRFDDGFQDY